jgi:hypothetical protein
MEERAADAEARAAAAEAQCEELETRAAAADARCEELEATALDVETATRVQRQEITRLQARLAHARTTRGIGEDPARLAAQLDAAEARAVAFEAELKRVLRDLSRAAPLSEAGSADSARGAPARHPSSESHSSLRVQIPPLPQVRACDAPPSAGSGSDADHAVSPQNIPARVPSEEHTPRSTLACMRSVR